MTSHVWLSRPALFLTYFSLPGLSQYYPGPYNFFSNPPPPNEIFYPDDFSQNKVYTIGEDIGVTLYTNWTSYNTTLLQHVTDKIIYMGPQVADLFAFDHLGGSPYSNTNGPTTDVWTVDIGSLELSDSPIFFMTVYGDVNNTIPKFSSSFFNISSASSVPSSTTMSALSPTTMISPSNLTATQTATTAPGAPSNASSSSHNHSSGLSTGAAAGLGAGVAVVALLILSVAAFGWWRHQRKKKLKQIPDRDLHIASPFLTNDEKSGFPLSTELDANDRRGSELPSEDVRRELAAEERVGEMDAIELMEDVEPVEMPTAEVHGEEFRNSRAKASRRSWGVALETLDQSKAGTERE